MQQDVASRLIVCFNAKEVEEEERPIRLDDAQLLKQTGYHVWLQRGGNTSGVGTCSLQLRGRFSDEGAHRQCHPCRPYSERSSPMPPGLLFTPGVINVRLIVSAYVHGLATGVTSIGIVESVSLLNADS